MPYIKLETNVTGDARELTAKLSAKAAEIIGKPEQYVMCSVHTAGAQAVAAKTTEMQTAAGDNGSCGTALFFAGSPDPAAYVEVKSIGLKEEKCKPIAEQLCGFIENELHIPPARVYIEFAHVAAGWWGWNGSTFG